MSERCIAHIAVYPASGALHSSEQDLSALAGYLKPLLESLPPEDRVRQVVLTNLKSESPVTFEQKGIRVEECWRRGSLSYAWGIFRRILRNRDYQIVHLQHEFNQFGGALTLPVTLMLLAAIRFIARRSLVITVHEVLRIELLNREFLDSVFIKYPAGITRLIVFLYYFLLGLIAHVLIAQDEVFAETLKLQYRAVAKVEIIRIGTEISIPAPRAESRDRWKFGRNDRVVLFFGTLDWRKGIDVLIDAWVRLPGEFGRFIIGGGAPPRVRNTPEYRSWRGHLETRVAGIDSIQCIGFVQDSDLATLFGAADIVVLPYIVPQRVSAVFNQAASFGVPMIASSVFQGRGDPVMFFDPTPSALALKLQRAFDGEMDELLEASLTFRRENSWEYSALKLLIIYRNLIAQTGAPNMVG